LSFSFTIQEKESILLYGFLKKFEADLKPELASLLRKLETVVFDHLSISEVETLISLQDESGGFIK